MLNRPVIVASNRGPFRFKALGDDRFETTRGAGGLVTAVSAVAQQSALTWVACAMNPDDHRWAELHPEATDIDGIRLRLIRPDEHAFHGYYNVISNPLLWFLQHAMWDTPRSPNITAETWAAWETGYRVINEQLADAIAGEVAAQDDTPVVILQDYHLYLCGHYLRPQVGEDVILQHFVHIPWPGPTHWTFLPPAMREAIFRSMCQLDIIGFQTDKDGLNFLRCCQSHIPGAEVTYGNGTVKLDGHVTRVQAYPISVDVDGLRDMAHSEAVAGYTAQFQRAIIDMQFVLRIDRAEPSKNIIRGFKAYEQLLLRHPEHRRRVQFLALLVPSRLEVEEYRDYLDEVMASAGWINAVHGSGEWEPVRLLVGDNYARAIAALRLYDVLLVNPIIDGMNLVAKEGAIVNDTDGVLILSEGAGAHEQLGAAALSVSPLDIVGQAEALHAALTMSLSERRERAEHLRELVSNADVNLWFRRQLEDAQTLLMEKTQ